MSREAQATREYEAKLGRARELLRLLSEDLDRHAAAQQQTPRDWGHTAAYALDLDGHVLAFARAD